jgi:hypothetical protein
MTAVAPRGDATGRPSFSFERKLFLILFRTLRSAPDFADNISGDKPQLDEISSPAKFP